MAGTLFGLGLSQRVTLNGLPDAGWLLYVYDAGTSTPASTFADTGLTTALSFPIEADSYGMLPDFWVADGSYRARATNSTGSAVFFDRDALLAIGPSSSSGGGGGGSTVDPNALLLTGDFFWKPVTGSRAGAVRANGLTIGSVSSGATERANSDTQSLYEYLWNNFNNTLCPVTSGRGAGATVDFVANKSIGTLSMRGYGPFGLDDMGNSAAGIISGGILAAASGGGSTATIAQANLPNISLAGSLDDPTITVSNGTNKVTTASDFTASAGAGQNNVPRNMTSVTVTAALNNSNVTVSLGGSGTALTTISPYRLGTWYIKL